MSALTQAFSYITGFFTPPMTTETPTSYSQTIAGQPKKPVEAGESYFPESATRRSSLSSTSTGSDDSLPAPKLPRSQTGDNPLDAMMRQYPRPVQEIDVARQLALAPPKHSLHSSLKRAATADRAIVIEDAETKARKMAAAKAELLALAGKP
ncbi:hypothetical protein PFICI_07341 [Pestalotiopsis fici W106-1]|uniref:Uncharacterized protein n=1 Tax=Pestalotiopsis fici (strain W106-1 / CGMCC3.15140) TaxID=1229662 RepID=W3X349_PESFW|nr:uncharacterized protein PFICI_07341 [Pestalotiopsis fici W106-1]ETS79812.1 hypothetical protein PFICI_07341 [Pestalotiopsis fici W106-1]